MSAIIAYTTKNYIVIATDTLSHTKGKDALIPCNFTSKTYYLPQQQSCFAILGFLGLAAQFYTFANEKIVAKDVGSLISICQQSFLQFLDASACPGEHVGTIYLFGYCTVKKGLRNFRLTITKSAIDIEEKGEREFFLKPEIKNTSEVMNRDIHLAQQIGELEFVKQKMIEMMGLQVAEDRELPVIEQVGIGGQIQITTMFITEQGTISYLVEMVHTFEGFDQVYEQMLRNGKRS
ncbi:hypothetical protein SAMN04488128_1011164 [Chitinophaga eiseniae]|uniref:20S proteasome, alpha and beta subunits n=1 Tax=Chitinophaga eiseniae TaxID=634771 RepID=A0A1T4MMH1_9BACT|nr:hypothetical protein [Chitinophaga eiseniae]SJZ67908.1 hypothetical protein SAMN04488128_1011164 [Chitinophaga eiseniae]